MRKILSTYIILLFSVLAWAQNGTTVATGLPYECSFEEDETLSCWRLNYGTPTAYDKWMFGSAVHSEGKRSMYISYDGTDPKHYIKPNVVVSYLRYKFPAATNTQQYDVSFDWKGMGDSTVSRLYVMCGLATQFFPPAGQTSNKDINNIISTTVGRISEDECELLRQGSDTVLYVYGSETWQNVSFASEIKVGRAYSNTEFMFVFIWVNGNTRDSVANTGVAIDNFQINSARIKKPTDLQVYPQCEDSSLLVTWKSQSAEFDVEYRATGTSRWYNAHGLRDGVTDFKRVGSDECSFKIRRILEGTYDVRVRALSRDENTNQTLITSFVYETQILVYCPDNHCINYINLYGPNVVCTYGEHEKHTGHTPFDNIGVIDYGPDSDNSRHTVHKDVTELDPRADSLLHTVPPGALASVRLGNWNASGKAQSITYTFKVDTATQGILIMKYAVVLDNSGHARDEEPYFRVEILDSLDQPLGNTCGKADFAYSDAVAKQDLESWHLTKYRGNELAWKDWTTVGVDLMDYHDMLIKVRITTADCGQTIHYGYGYFTLDCANAHIETNNCGNDASITCRAPDGFSYEWFNELGVSVSKEQELSVGASRQVYTCRVSYTEDPSCYFELRTLSAPRFPVPEYSFERVYSECSSKLVFTNTSHVMNKFEGYENHTSEPCTDWAWSIRRLSNDVVTLYSQKDLIYTCPPMGDSLEIKCTAYIGADNACEDTRTDTIVVPSIYSEPTSFHYTSCDGVRFDNQWFETDTTYVGKFTNFAGCDSTSTLYLKIYPKSPDQYRHDSICSDQAVVINGIRYNQSVENFPIFLKNAHDCDSIIYLTLTVNDRLKATIDPVPAACADDEQLFIYMNIAAGVYDSLQIKFNTPEIRDTIIYDQVTTIAIPYAESIKPGHYEADLTFYQFCCGTYNETRGFDIRYRSSIVEQKWNDVLTLLAPKYNGGWEFVSYQWYKNGMPIAGANHSYLYEPLDFDALYYVEIMRSDSVLMTTCPIQPVYHEQQSEYPTIVTAGNRIPMYMEQPATIWYYTVSGQLYSTFGLPQGYTSLATPDQTGIYIIKSVNASGETKAQVMIVQ